MNPDIFDNGTPKYSTALDIYDALCELVKTEEMGILADIGADVSWEGQDYYYTDKGNELKEKFEALCDYGNEMWRFDMAVLLMGEWEAQDFIYEALLNDDLAKLIGFRKLFIEHMLDGDAKKYIEISEAYSCELQELDRFGYYNFLIAYQKIINEYELPFCSVNPYSKFASRVAESVRKKLKLPEHQQMIIECRALLTSYDDFMFGLRANQTLYEYQEQQHQAKMALLQSDFEKRISQLMFIAEKKGLLEDFSNEINLLEPVFEPIVNTGSKETFEEIFADSESKEEFS